MSWTRRQNVSIKTYFMYTLLRCGFELDMKKEGKESKERAPGEGNGAWGNAGSRQGARRSICLSGYEYSHPTPSKDDIVITRQLKSAGGNLRIRLLDHIIFSHRGYYSYVENGGLE